MGDIADTQTWVRTVANWGEVDRRPGGHRQPAPTAEKAHSEVSGWTWVAGLLTIVALLLAAGLLFVAATDRPQLITPDGDGGGVVSAEVAPASWGIGGGRASDRVIEVVDGIPGARWDVKSAARWLDRYTISRMKMVTKCSGKAYRCVTVRAGKVKGGSVGWAKGTTITIDTVKAGAGAYREHYRKAAVRRWLLVHELAHTFGLKHSAGRNVMNPVANRAKLVFTKSQRVKLAKV